MIFSYYCELSFASAILSLKHLKMALQKDNTWKINWNSKALTASNYYDSHVRLVHNISYCYDTYREEKYWQIHNIFAEMIKKNSVVEYFHL